MSSLNPVVVALSVVKVLIETAPEVNKDLALLVVKQVMQTADPMKLLNTDTQILLKAEMQKNECTTGVTHSGKYGTSQG